jgi:multidrug efflux pump
MGHLPLVFARGPRRRREEQHRHHATGMIIGTCFTLLVVPSIYVLVARTHKRIEAIEDVSADLEPMIAS